MCRTKTTERKHIKIVYVYRRINIKQKAMLGDNKRTQTKQQNKINAHSSTEPFFLSNRSSISFTSRTYRRDSSTRFKTLLTSALTASGAQ
jgi:hypothetical protein